MNIHKDSTLIDENAFHGLLLLKYLETPWRNSNIEHRSTVWVIPQVEAFK